MIKKIVLSVSLLVCQISSFCQSVPTCPTQLEYANITVILTEDAKKLIDNEINAILVPPNKFLDQKIERIQWYFPIIEKILEDEHVPDDLKYLAVMESALISEAVSSSNAVGFWQFKEGTGKENGILINNVQDQRKNIFVSTKAAAFYLTKNNLILKNWISTILSFNTGLTGSKQHIDPTWENSGQVKLDGKIHPYLVKAIAARIAYEHRVNRTRESDRKFTLVPGAGKSLAEIALETNTTVDEIKKYNSWFNSDNVPTDKNHTILVLTSIEKGDEISTRVKKQTDLNTSQTDFPKLVRITKTSTSPDQPIFYTINGKKGILVQKGDEAAQVSKKTKVKLKSFLAYNDLSEKEIVKPNKVYYLEKKAKKAQVPFHTVNDSQTMWDVSQMYGVKLQKLQAYNKMGKAENPLNGRVLWLQKTRPKNKPIEYIKPQKTQPIVEESEPEVASTETSTSEQEPMVKTESIVRSSEKNESEPVVETREEKKVEIAPMKADDPIFDPNKSEVKGTPVAKKSKGKEVLMKPENTNTEEVIVAKPNSKPETKMPNKGTHIVKQGETLYAVATKYGLSTKTLRELNNITSNGSIKTGQSLIVHADATPVSINPTPEEKPAAASKPASKPEPKTTESKERKIEIISEEPVVNTEAQPKKPVSKANSDTEIHVVSKGETSYSISKKYGLTVDQLYKINKMTEPTIEIGQELIVSKGSLGSTTKPLKKTEPKVVEKTVSPEVEESKGIVYHTVASGETLYSISNKYKTTQQKLIEWNSLKNNNVPLGKKLIVKK
ncbi:MAG: LysM peptidoglycan-binding domain-containing protein [Leadbetterella sp.]